VAQQVRRLPVARVAQRMFTGSMGEKPRMLFRQNVPLILGRSASFEKVAVARRLQVNPAISTSMVSSCGVTSRFARRLRNSRLILSRCRSRPAIMAVCDATPGQSEARPAVCAASAAGTIPGPLTILGMC